ncbi:MAG: O-antigen ligase family protein [Pseudomonadales bacterium]|nr:O-antigen ligase family protein [Pseudomonadales bacterium]
MGKTFSRTCMATLGIMMVLSFALRGDGNVVKKILVAGIVGVMLVGSLSFMPGPMRDRLNTIRDAGEDESFQGRIRAWGYGFDMVSWYPITGVGKSQWYKHHGRAPHNSFVQIMAELGLPGITLFLWVVMLSFKEFIPILMPSNPGPPPNSSKKKAKESSVRKNNDTAFSFSNEKRKSKNAASFEFTNKVTNTNKTIAIAIVSTFVGFLIYIFLGNQGYGVWTYFYIGVCAAVRNLIHVPEPKKKRRFSEATTKIETS